MRKFFSKNNLFSTVLSVALSFVFVATVAFASTTINTNIVTNGTLQVDSTSTLTGAVTASGALTVTGVHIDNGQFQASSTALFGSGITAYSTLTANGNVTLGDAASDVIIVTGNASTTNALTVGGNFYVGGRATTTASTGNAEMVGGLTVGTATTNSLAGTILLSAQTSDPTGVTQGTFYYNSTSKVLKMFDGTNWFTVGTTTSGITLVAPRLQLADLTTQYMTLGTTTQQGLSTLTVEATSTASIPLTVVGFNAQTTHLLDVVNAGGTKLLYVNSGGGLFGSSTLQVTGVITAYGNVILGDAASDAITLTGNASTTNAFTVGTNLYVGGNATTTSAGAISTQGTLNVTGLTILGFASTTAVSLNGANSNLMVNGMATTTASNGNILTLGSLSVGTTTAPSAGVIITTGNIGTGTSSPTDEISALSSATTTLGAYSSGVSKGGCIQLTATNGTLYRMYVNATTDVATTTSTGHAGIIAVWEAGSCK